MPTNGSTKDYDFGRKNHWRRTLWNEVLRRTDGREKSEVILYLAGPNDLDRSVAMEKGAPSRNLIAIDRNQSNVQTVRSNGNSAICGDVVDILTTWPKRTAVCAIVLDFCSGFQCLDDLRRIADLSGLHPSFRQSILAVNMMRGRDAETNTLRQNVGMFNQKWLALNPKHRGAIFAQWYIGQFMVTDNILPMAMSEPIKVWNAMWQMFNPKFFEYQSGALCFDSVVINSAGMFFDLDPSADVKNKRVSDALYAHGNKEIALSTAATIAVRTRRMRADA